MSVSIGCRFATFLFLVEYFLGSAVHSLSSPGLGRRAALRQAISGAFGAAVFVDGGIQPTSVANAATPKQEKLLNLSNEELAKLLVSDVEDHQFMVCADLTRALYDESATFTDEIDTYQMDPWIKGTKRLFIKDKSKSQLVPDTMKVTDTEVTYRFTEYLTFNIPFLQPKVYLSGGVILTRDPNTGLITSYTEEWDQDVNTVIKTATFGG